MTALDIGRTHLENIIVGLDWQATRQQEELQDSSLPRTPLATSITSFIGTQAAGHPKPMWHKSPNSTAETQWIQFLERAHAEGQEVTVVVRGICGYSVWPDSFGSILGRFGGGSNPLVVRLGFALRRNFVAYANCCLPPGDHPFLLPKNVTVNARGFHHTALVNIRALHDEYNARIVDPLAHRLNRWFWEEAAARNGHGGMGAEVALRVKNIRSHDRNRIVAG
ncbi:hypothetical protein CKM354_000727900 [Cercospora kikuchii]|uniref:Uncharacterized protein n=1 Tax=Cercospora kikuchii TaxID=84275 RepID=A0A9P3FJ08_9PEZI|nr:uncharacterized protein CKM354_000727900 [Cercospora kikuchii]GIZ44070.1 hypothetical protein CKM354_000727900 [Cercospora kikuchii]